MTDLPARLLSALADRYRLERELGQGGMATVYLAQDLKHDRRVALKVLKPELAAVLGAERFITEIKTTAALQHPHILPLFDSGVADGFLYYVMPYIQGETLRSKLDRETQLGIDEAVRIAREVADALDYAHRHGVIHRDIKPENILLHDGRPMVADFGIALALSAAAGGRMTETGMSLGTPHYMSPEQATAEKELSGRSDVYSLASVLYEMLTGEPPHMGKSAQQIIMKIIAEPVKPVTDLRKSVPPHVADAVAQALEKLPADRFASAKEFADALAGEGTAVSPRRTRLQATAARPTTRLPALPVLTVLTVLAALAAWGWLRPRTLPRSPPETRFVIEHSEVGAFEDAAGSPLAFSPDGSQLVYVGRDAEGRQHLFRRGLDNPEPALLPGTEGARSPFFSPDGLEIGFIQGDRLRTKALAGGPVATLSENGSQHASWGPDANIWVVRTNALERIPARGGAAGETVFQLDSAGGRLLRWPDALPNGRGVLVTLIEGLEPRLAVVTLPDRTLKLLGPAGMYPRWVEKGYLVWVDLDGTLLAARFDDRALLMTGPPQPIASGVRYGPAFPGKLAVSRSGAMAYFGGNRASRELVLVNLVAGREEVLQRGAFYSMPRFSPDGRRLAFNIYEFAGLTSSDVWTYDFATGSVSRESFDARSFFPEWLADSRRILVAGLDFRRILMADGSGRTDTLRRDWGDGTIDEVHLLPDEQRAVYTQRSGGERDIFVISLVGDSEPEPLQATRFNERGLALSPDGGWLAYVSDESGTEAVYLRAVSGGGGRLRVSPGAGREPRWGPGGRALYYRSSDSVLVVAVTPGEVPSTGAPRLAWTGTYVTDAGRPAWDVSPDGGRFVFTRSEEGPNRRLNVVLHWFDSDARREP